MHFKILFAVTLAVVTSCNDVFWLENELKVNGDDPNDKWLRENKQSKTKQNDNKLLSKHSKLICYHHSDQKWFFCSFVLIWSLHLVTSTVDLNTLSTRKNKQQNKRLLGQLSESDAHFMFGRNRYEALIKSKASAAHRDTSLNDQMIQLKLMVNEYICTNLSKTLIGKHEVKWILWWQRFKLKYRTQCWLQ